MIKTIIKLRFCLKNVSVFRDPFFLGFGSWNYLDPSHLQNDKLYGLQLVKVFLDGIVSNKKLSSVKSDMWRGLIALLLTAVPNMIHCTTMIRAMVLQLQKGEVILWYFIFRLFCLKKCITIFYLGSPSLHWRCDDFSIFDYLCIDWFLSTEKVKYGKSERAWEVMIVNSIMRLSLLHGVLTKWEVSLSKALAAMKGLPLLKERL